MDLYGFNGCRWTDYEIVIKSPIKGTYTCNRRANTPELAVSMVKLEDGEEIVDVRVKTYNSEWK